MHKIDEAELIEIIKSYGLGNLIFGKHICVEPDTCLYTFYSDTGKKYVLVASDYLGHYVGIELPYDFEYDYYVDSIVKFHAIRRFSYIDGAPKKAEGYIDDEHLWTTASTGDVCMLFECDRIELPSGA